MEIRFAREEELSQVNGLREQLHALHRSGKPEIFKPGFPERLREYVYEIYEDPRKRILVCENGGRVCAFAVLHHVVRPETPYMFERDYLDVDEFGVAEDCRRQGVGTAMIGFIRALAAREGFDRVELNMWEFNREALAFYEAVGFSTYRRYMELKL